MADSLTLLDQALSLGEQELNALAAGDVDVAHENSGKRSQLLAEAWEQRDGVAVEDLQNKLMQLQSLQGRLSEEAKRLHVSLKSELQKTKKHSRRLTGYRQAVRVTPLHSHFVSKQG